MDVQYTPVAVCMFAAAALSAFNALFIWRRRRQVGAHALVLLMLPSSSGRYSGPWRRFLSPRA